MTKTITHRNGGFEQGILEQVNKDGLLSDEDKKRLEYLQSLPQDRTEVNIDKNDKPSVASKVK